MKISEKWLREWINPKASTTECADQFTMLGLTVDAIAPVAGAFSNVVIGAVLETKPHPNAGKLTCCVVDVGKSKPLSIVCGAANVRKNLKVAVAMVGATLPGDVHIKAVELRGERSEGMICSQSELQLMMGKTEFPGIIELPQDAPVGKNFRDYFCADDFIFDVEITPNRGDCLSTLGLARELSARNQIKINFPRIAPAKITSKKTLPVALHAESACPRYLGRVIEKVNVETPTPAWIKQRLERANVRCINVIVDIANYVTLELGQPLHAFDLAKLHTELHVRFAKKSEKLRLLDESEITLSEQDLVIADQKNILALAGIMGGLDSGVNQHTTDIFLESAFFSPKNIALSARAHHITSDAAYRFERGVDFELPSQAIERATTLILEIAGGFAGKITHAASKTQLPKRATIILARDNIAKILGMTISDARITAILKSLCMQVSKTKNGWKVTPPSFRFDITQSVDLIEELARINGYQHIPQTPLHGVLSMKESMSETRVCLRRLKQTLIDRDYHEAITYSFIDPKLSALFSPHATTITLQNPIAQDMSCMRVSILPGLLSALSTNLNHQCDRVRLFEAGMCFEYHNQVLQQPQKLAWVATGFLNPEQWSEKSRAVDFYDIKNDVMALLQLSHHNDAQFEKATHVALHPGRSMAVYRDKKCLGYFGELHPRIASELGLKTTVVLAEFDLDLLRAGRALRFTPFSKYPSVRRDLALVVDESVTADAMQTAITQTAGSMLTGLHIFDIYQGAGIETGKKSVALGLTFLDSSRTLRDEEINEVIHRVVTMLQRDLNATLRE